MALSEDSEVLSSGCVATDMAEGVVEADCIVTWDGVVENGTWSAAELGSVR